MTAAARGGTGMLRRRRGCAQRRRDGEGGVAMSALRGRAARANGEFGATTASRRTAAATRPPCSAPHLACASLEVGGGGVGRLRIGS
jgi:hypothetical protein